MDASVCYVPIIGLRSNVLIKPSTHCSNIEQVTSSATIQRKNVWILSQFQVKNSFPSTLSFYPFS